VDLFRLFFLRAFIFLLSSFCPSPFRESKRSFACLITFVLQVLDSNLLDFLRIPSVTLHRLASFPFSIHDAFWRFSRLLVCCITLVVCHRRVFLPLMKLVDVPCCLFLQSFLPLKVFPPLSTLLFLLQLPLILATCVPSRPLDADGLFPPVFFHKMVSVVPESSNLPCFPTIFGSLSPLPFWSLLFMRRSTFFSSLTLSGRFWALPRLCFFAQRLVVGLFKSLSGSLLLVRRHLFWPVFDYTRMWFP